MRIQTNTLLNSPTKKITFTNNCVVAKDGPNILGKLDLSSLDISYDSFFAASQILQNDSGYQPITYGTVGEDITLLVIKPDYNENPQVCPEDAYVSYYYEDEPTIIRTFTDILALSGNEDHRIPQIYVYNPRDTNITLDILAANIDTTTVTASTSTTIVGLSYNSIISDQIYGVYTGSTQFEILDIDDEIQLVITYDTINIVEIEDDTITITTTSDTPIELTFLSQFNTLQAYSRINWVTSDENSRYLTKINLSIDTTSPVITYNSGMTGSTYVITDIGSGITSQNLIDLYIDTIIDYDNNDELRDGSINKDNATVIIIKTETGEEETTITENGYYDVTFKITDLADNTTTDAFDLLVDDTAPIIYYTSNIQVSEPNGTMDLTGDTATPGTINTSDINTYWIDYVEDDVDGIIANSAVTITIASGATSGITGITEIGNFELNFSVSDTAGNLYSTGKTLTVTEPSFPVINYNDVFTATTFEMSITPSAITAAMIRTYAISSVTDAYDGIIDTDEVILYKNGVVYTQIVSAGSWTIRFDVSDASGNLTQDEKTLTTTS